VPGLNVQGEYWRDYGRDPMKWVKSELDICRNWHHLFMPMVGADPKFCRDNKKFWLTGGGVHDHWGAAAGSNPVQTTHAHTRSCGCG
jgi:hypothetical protein